MRVGAVKFSHALFYCLPTQATEGIPPMPQEENCKEAPTSLKATLLTLLPLPLSAAKVAGWR